MVKTDRLLLKYIGKYKIQRIAKIILLVKNNVKGLIHLISKLAVKANNYDSVIPESKQTQRLMEQNKVQK